MHPLGTYMNSATPCWFRPPITTPWKRTQDLGVTFSGSVDNVGEEVVWQRGTRAVDIQKVLSVLSSIVVSQKALGYSSLIASARCS